MVSYVAAIHQNRQLVYMWKARDITWKRSIGRVVHLEHIKRKRKITRLKQTIMPQVCGVVGFTVYLSMIFFGLTECPKWAEILCTRLNTMCKPNCASSLLTPHHTHASVCNVATAYVRWQYSNFNRSIDRIKNRVRWRLTDDSFLGPYGGGGGGGSDYAHTTYWICTVTKLFPTQT